MKACLFLVWTGAIGFFLEQNFYFGWNTLAHSDAELIADGINILLVSIAALTTILAYKEGK